MIFTKAYIISLLSIILLGNSCSPAKQDPNPDYIRIGNGGGFAGIETIYTINLKGPVDQGGAKIGSLKKSDINQLTRNIEVLQLDQLDWNQPGNMYKFIEYKLGSKMHRMSWDSNSPDVNNNLNLFYNHALHLIQKLNS